MALLQDFNARSIADSGLTGYLHVGDIPHRLFNGLRGEGLERLVHIWEDASASIVGWVLVSPKHMAIDVQIGPGARQDHPSLDDEMIEWAESAVVANLGRPAIESDQVAVDVSAGDAAFAARLESRGYARGEVLYVLTEQTLRDRPPPVVAPGFVIRSPEGPHEAGAISDVHAAGFGSTWTEEAYRKVMASPGYDPQRELLAVAPDGRFAGFCVIWFDQVNGIGLFEPVATHPDFRRMGVGRALLAEGMARMRDAGMTRAIVTHEAGNPAAAALYAQAGFRAAEDFVSYSKPLDDFVGGRTAVS